MKKIIFVFLISSLFSSAWAQGKIPIEYYSHIYLKGSLNGTAVSNFVFDTGAHDLYIDSCYYAESGLEFVKLANANLPGAGTGLQKVKVVMDKLSYAFSDNVYHPKYGVLFHLRPILGDFADGIVGKNYFENQCLEVNYEKKYMKKYSSISDIDLDGYKKLAGKNVDGKFLYPLTLRVTDKIIINDYFTLDLGSASAVIVNSLVAKKYDLDNNINKKVKFYTTQGGVGGDSQSYSFIIPEVSIAGYTLKNVDASYSVDKAGALAATTNAGLLGNLILERFSIIMDFKNNNLYLKPRENFNKPFDQTTYGFSFSNRYKTGDGYWEVNGFYEGLPTEASGLKIGDKIIEVNGIPVKDISTFEKESGILRNDTLLLKIERKDAPLHIKITKENLFK